MAPDMLHPHLVHPHTGAALVALGLRRDGRPIWPVIGASPDDGDNGDGGDDQDDGGGDDGADGDDQKNLGDAGKNAIERMKRERTAAKTEARAWKSLASEFGATSPDDLRALLGKPKSSDGQKDDEKPDADAIRRDARREAQQTADLRIIRAEIKAAAGSKLADPADAARFLDLSQFQLDDDGELDQDEVADAITDLLRRKPYLAAAGKNDDDEDNGRRRRAPRPDRSQGPRGRGVSDSKEQAREQLARRGYAQTTQ